MHLLIMKLNSCFDDSYQRLFSMITSLQSFSRAE